MPGDLVGAGRQGRGQIGLERLVVGLGHGRTEETPAGRGVQNQPLGLGGDDGSRCSGGAVGTGRSGGRLADTAVNPIRPSDTAGRRARASVRNRSC